MNLTDETSRNFERRALQFMISINALVSVPLRAFLEVPYAKSMIYYSNTLCSILIYNNQKMGKSGVFLISIFVFINIVIFHVLV